MVMGSFKPGIATLHALQGVGITGKHPTLSFNVAINDDERTAVAIALSTLVRGGALNKHEQYVKGMVNLLPHELKLKGKAAWDSNLPVLATIHMSGEKWADRFKEESYSPSPTAMMHSCPECGGLESSLRAKFQRRDLDEKLKCGFCLKTTAVKKWLCNCAKPWHACNDHAHGLQPKWLRQSEGQLLNGHLSDSVSDPKPMPKASNRRLRATEDILADDHRRAKAQRASKGGEKRRADICFDINPAAFKRPTRLGPILSERFNGASASASSS